MCYRSLFYFLAVESETAKPATEDKSDPKKLKKEISVESTASTGSADGDKKQVRIIYYYFIVLAFLFSICLNFEV